MKEKEHLNFISVAAMYVGVIVGAAFAVLAFMIGFLAAELKTEDMGRIISLVDNKKITESIGCFMAVFLFTTIISMTAAGGSFLYQQFGIHKAIGGGIIAVLVAVTVLGDFKRISGFFKYIVPILFAVVMGMCFYIILSGTEQSGKTYNFQQPEIISSWYVAAPLYVAYRSSYAGFFRKDFNSGKYCLRNRSLCVNIFSCYQCILWFYHEDSGQAL